MPNGKAPGPDGFRVDFYKKYWHVIGYYLWQSILELEVSSYLPLSWSLTYLCFIPKKEHPERVADYIGLFRYAMPPIVYLPKCLQPV